MSGAAFAARARKERCATALWTTVTTGTEQRAPLRFPRACGSIGHLTEMGNHRDGSGNGIATAPMSSGPDQDAAGR